MDHNRVYIIAFSQRLYKIYGVKNKDVVDVDFDYFLGDKLLINLFREWMED